MTYHAIPQHATDYRLYGSLTLARHYHNSDVTKLDKTAGTADVRTDRFFADSAKNGKTSSHPSHVLLATADSTQIKQ